METLVPSVTSQPIVVLMLYGLLAYVFVFACLRLFLALLQALWAAVVIVACLVVAAMLLGWLEWRPRALLPANPTITLPIFKADDPSKNGERR